MDTPFLGYPEIVFPILPALHTLAHLPINPDYAVTYHIKVKRYKRVGTSGNIVFYDRIVDMGEFE